MTTVEAGRPEHFEAVEFGQRMSRLTASLKRQAESAIVIVYARAMDDALGLVSASADQTIRLVPRPDEPRPSVKVAARSKARWTQF